MSMHVQLFVYGRDGSLWELRVCFLHVICMPMFCINTERLSCKGNCPVLK